MSSFLFLFLIMTNMQQSITWNIVYTLMIKKCYSEFAQIWILSSSTKIAHVAVNVIDQRLSHFIDYHFRF